MSNVKEVTYPTVNLSPGAVNLFVEYDNTGPNQWLAFRLPRTPVMTAEGSKPALYLRVGDELTLNKDACVLRGVDEGQYHGKKVTVTMVQCYKHDEHGNVVEVR